MREDQMRRVSIDCALKVVRGDSIEQDVADAAVRLVGADAGFGFTEMPLNPVSVHTVRLTFSGAEPMPQRSLVGAITRLSKHPTLGRADPGGGSANRLSDYVDLHRFWDTDLWWYFHGHVNGRYGATVSFGIHNGTAMFVGGQRMHTDFDSDDLAVLDAAREPLTSALAFRAALDRAADQLAQHVQGRDSRLTAREADVVSLVSRGWTNQHIGRTLGITERTVRKHLSNAFEKLHVSSRAAAAATWTRSLADQAQRGRTDRARSADGA
jgi:DNA-binding CsgD family transcriptional regulator